MAEEQGWQEQKKIVERAFAKRKEMKDNGQPTEQLEKAMEAAIGKGKFEQLFDLLGREQE